jgi:superfamily I DNA and/or RNA helicase
MILDTIKTDTTFKVEAKNLSQKRVPNGGLGFLKYNNSYSIFIEDKLYEIEIIDKNKLNEIDFFFLNRNYTAVVNIVESIRDTLFTMEIIFFTFPIKEIFVPFYVSLGDKILETAKKRGIIKYRGKLGDLRGKDLEKAKQDLEKNMKEKISLKINGEEYFLVSTAISSENEIFEEELSKIGQNIKKVENSKNLSEEEKKQYIEENQENINKMEFEKKDLAFSIHGENIHIPVKQEKDDSGKYKFNATKLISFRNSIQKDSLRLLKGKIEFKSGLVSEKIVKELGNIVEGEGSYLNTWDIYLEKEGEILLDRAKEIGILEILHSKTAPDLEGYVLKIKDLTKEKEDLLNEGDYLSFVDKDPDYINDNLTWLEHIAQKEQQTIIKKRKPKNNFFEIKKVGDGFITIKTDNNISQLPSNKKAVLSIYGDEIQLQRKLNARKRLLEGRSANPLLGLIIEDTDNIKQYQKTSKTKILEPLTPYVKDKIFPTNDPTKNQIDAIDIALNTPDIAIIQGPPGTGKTTVLTAIIERLNEESDKENLKGQILIAGFQHDAVENIIERLEINGLPTPKFGKKSTSVVDMSSYERILEWSEKIASNVKKQLPELTHYLKINKLNSHFEIYLRIPSKESAKELLKYIINELNIFLDEKTIIDAKQILESLKKENMGQLDELKSIYSLRTTTDSFLDDGNERNIDLLVSEIGQNLSDEEKKILQFSDLTSIDKYLPKLQKLKYNLIDRLYPKPLFRAEKPNENIIKLKEKVENELSNGTNTKDKIHTLLANYVNELEANPFGLKSMIEEYSYVYSSTTGQSSKAVKEKIGQDRANEDKVSFDTLIIDEAARVAPMDLLVAMVLAKRRIILVGDHRQLPHMVDDEIIKDANLSENDFINESMFGYLKRRSEKLEKFDGIKRSITLNNQYRTHPILGEFISKNFYEKYEESFNSPLGREIGTIDKFFHQDLKEIENNTPAIWIDVPTSACKEKRDEFKSLFRLCEAQKIIKYLRKWILSEQGKGLTFGIITFYRGQVNMLNELVEKEFTKEERSSFYSRLRIGTVDSFQGMEFDIVFLSIVRSRDIKTINENLEDYSLFGFLISKNRLCVSMSRQKKSLIIVGDKDFYESDRAKKDVEELYNFLQLCKNKGKIL